MYRWLRGEFMPAASALHKKTGHLAFANENLQASKSILSRFAESFDDDEPLRTA
jgi:hypothetical protein